MAGVSRTTFFALLLAGLVGTAGQAQVPLPPPAPQPKAGGAPPPPAYVTPGRPGMPAAPPQAPAAGGGPSWLPSFLGGGGAPAAAPARPATTTAFDPAQRALVDKVSGYLSNVRVLSGDFNQISPDGRRAKGSFYMLKPGKVRFEYDPPSPIDIVSDGSSVVVRDRKLATQDVYPLSQTPLRFLLQDRIDLLRDTNVVAVRGDDTHVTVVVEEKQVLVGTNRLMMMFGIKDGQLKQWVVTDPQGFDTTVAVSNLDSARRPDPNLFRIDYTDYRN